jgi:hypothetical protein
VCVIFIGFILFILFSFLLILYLENKKKKDIHFVLVMGLFIYWNILQKVFILSICNVYGVSHITWWIFLINFLLFILACYIFFPLLKRKTTFIFFFTSFIFRIANYFYLPEISSWVNSVTVSSMLPETLPTTFTGQDIIMLNTENGKLEMHSSVAEYVKDNANTSTKLVHKAIRDGTIYKDKYYIFNRIDGVFTQKHLDIIKKNYVPELSFEKYLTSNKDKTENKSVKCWISSMLYKDIVKKFAPITYSKEFNIVKPDYDKYIKELVKGVDFTKSDIYLTIKGNPNMPSLNFNTKIQLLIMINFFKDESRLTNPHNVSNMRDFFDWYHKEAKDRRKLYIFALYTQKFLYDQKMINDDMIMNNKNLGTYGNIRWHKVDMKSLGDLLLRYKNHRLR